MRFTIVFLLHSAFPWSLLVLQLLIIIICIFVHSVSTQDDGRMKFTFFLCRFIFILLFNLHKTWYCFHSWKSRSVLCNFIKSLIETNSRDDCWLLLIILWYENYSFESSMFLLILIQFHDLWSQTAKNKRINAWKRTKK